MILILILLISKSFFGVPNDKCVSYLFLLLKYYTFLCKFKDALPNFVAFKSFVNKQKEIEYYLAKKRNILPVHKKNEICI